jgi:small subunit ribosomal protein S1
MPLSALAAGKSRSRRIRKPMTEETTNALADAEGAPTDEAAAEAAAEETTETVETAPEAAAAEEEVTSDIVEEAVEEAAADPEVDDEASPEPAPASPEPAPASEKAPLGDLPADLSEEDFAAAVEKTVVEFSEGSLVTGTVVRVDPDEVLVDIGYKSEGVVPVAELSIRNSVNPAEIVSVGDQIEALVMQMEDQDGRLILSKKRDIGLRGFLPASLVELRRVRDLHPYVGESLEAKVIELDKNRNNVVLSRRAFLEEEQAEQRQAFLDDLAPDEIRTGVVSSVVNFGAFVDLGGMDGLVHVSELSWQHVSHPSEIVSVGEEVTVKVLEVDYERERISLSIRQTREDPWESFADAHGVGDVVDGAVTKTVPFGAFVSVTDGVEGLVHVSEIAIHHVESPELELSVGQSVKVKITEIDADRRRISLSIKQASPEWQERAQWQEPHQRRPRRSQQEFEREEEVAEDSGPPVTADLEAILQELKEKGIGRK